MTARHSRGDAAATFARVNERYRPAIEQTLRRLVGARRSGTGQLLRYHFGWEDQRRRRVRVGSGKMLRPALCLLACEAVGGSWRKALPAAASIELLHNFTLIHDDVEDGSAQRHGRPTVWRVWGKELAINAGDGAFALAHVAMLDLARKGYSSERVVRALRLLDETTLSLCDGQHLDLVESGRKQLTMKGYLNVILGKSAALISASAGIGALLGGANERTIGRFLEYGNELGLAFQVRDDVLGIWGQDAMTGKLAGDDSRASKQSYPVICAREKASPTERRKLDALLKRAMHSKSIAGQARQEFERLGVREAGERLARKHAERATESLPSRLSPARHAELEAIARFAASRDR